MKLQLSANSIIDSLIPFVDDMEERYINVPRGVLIRDDGPYKPYIDKEWLARRAFNLANDLLVGISLPALYGTVLAARRWYNRTNWQKSLPEGEALRLLNCMVEQNPDGRCR